MEIRFSLSNTGDVRMGRGERVRTIDASCLENLSLINFNSTGIPRDMASKTSRYLSLETIARSRATRKKKGRESTSEKTKEEKWREPDLKRGSGFGFQSLQKRLLIFYPYSQMIVLKK